MKRRWGIFLGTALIVFIVDISTKIVIEEKLRVGDEIKITEFLNIVHVRNRGSVFGLFSDIESRAFRIVFNTVSIFAIAFLIYFSKFFRGFPFYMIGGMLGGAVGNIYERLAKGYVVDFIDFHIGEYHWPAFNIADSTITIGMIVILLYSLSGFSDEIKAKGTKDEKDKEEVINKMKSKEQREMRADESSKTSSEK
jgi:signal peptidase II